MLQQIRTQLTSQRIRLLHHPTLDPLYLSRTSQAFGDLIPSPDGSLGLNTPFCILTPEPATLIRIFNYLVTLNRRNFLGWLGSTGCVKLLVVVFGTAEVEPVEVN
jgi:hypothetical protein